MSRRKTSKQAHVYTGKPIPFNERESNGVKYWSTRNDANYNNSHAAALDIEFFAFPHQGYTSAHIAGHTARVSRRLFPEGWFCSIHRGIGGGKTQVVKHEVLETSDAAFMFAASELRKIEKEEQ